MKRLWLVGLVIAAMVVPAISFSQVETGAGTLQIGGKIKWLYSYVAEDEDPLFKNTNNRVSNYWGNNGAPVENFATTNVELDVSGTVGDNVSFLIELQAANSNPLWASNPNDMGWVGVRQAKIMVSDLIPMTTVTLGTFNLPVSNYQPRATNDWDLIMLPLINGTLINSSGNLLGGAYAPIGLGWQATGALFTIKPMDMVSLDLAYFNGNAGGAPNVDIDLEKSWLVKLGVAPVEGLKLELSYLTEGWQEDLNGGGSTEQQNAAGWVVSGCYMNDKLEANFDWVSMTAKDYTMDKKGKADDLNWTGYQITAGYWVLDQLEALVRYEFVDPNTENDKKNAFVQSEYDDWTWITLGLNYRLNDNAEVSLNYIFTQEPGSKIDADKGKYPANNIKYQQIDDDILLIQVQLWQ